MPVMDEFKEEREKLKDASFEKKWKYFKDYYLMWVIVAAVIIAIIGPIIFSVLTRKEDALYVCMLNFVEHDNAESIVKNAFVIRSGINEKKERIVIDTSIFIAPSSDVDSNGDALPAAYETAGENYNGNASENSAVSDNYEYSITDTVKYGYEDGQKLSALLTTGSCDLVITGEDIFSDILDSGGFAPLSEIYSESVLQAYDDDGRLLYRDGIAYGIFMDDVLLLNECYTYDGMGKPRIVAGVVFNGQHKELSKSFLDFLEGK